VGEPGYTTPVAFKLDLPENMRVQNVFHMSLLKAIFARSKRATPSYAHCSRQRGVV